MLDPPTRPVTGCRSHHRRLQSLRVVVRPSRLHIVHAGCVHHKPTGQDSVRISISVSHQGQRQGQPCHSDRASVASEWRNPFDSAVGLAQDKPMVQQLEYHCPRLPHRFLDSASGLARNDSLGVMTDPEVIVPGSPSDAAPRWPLSLFTAPAAVPGDIRSLAGVTLPAGTRSRCTTAASRPRSTDQAARSPRTTPPTAAATDRRCRRHAARDPRRVPPGCR